MLALAPRLSRGGVGGMRAVLIYTAAGIRVEAPNSLEAPNIQTSQDPHAYAYDTA